MDTQHTNNRTAGPQAFVSLPANEVLSLLLYLRLKNIHRHPLPLQNSF